MTERKKLLESIVEIAVDYRQGGLNPLPPPTPEHVDKWVKQFDDSVQLPILQEMAHVLKKTYFSREGTKKFLATLFRAENLVGDDPCAFWKSVKFLSIQKSGASQKEMLELFSEVLERECGFRVNDCGGATPHTFIYLDDGIFTGNRVWRDFEAWIKEEAPKKSKVHVITIALHTGGRYHAGKCIEADIRSSGKEISFQWWRAVKMEDRRGFTETSDVLRPVIIPKDDAVEEYVAGMRYKPVLRPPGNIGKNEIFSSDKNRQILEREFLKAGVWIRNQCPHFGDTQRPLGHVSLVTLGFGSLIVTFRNCPNNAPLALWAGNPWYPLFCRATNTETSQQGRVF